MKTPPPTAAISTKEEFQRAVRRIAELNNSQRDSIDEAVLVGLMQAVDAWKSRARQSDRTPDKKGRRHHEG